MITHIGNMDTIKIYNLLCFLVLISSHNFKVIAVRCLACDGLLEPWHCTTIRNCPSGHLCGIKQYRDINQNVKYILDCFPNLMCDSLKGNRHISNSSERAQERLAVDVTTCASCCNGDFCNSQGCGSTGYPANRGPVCFQCNEARNPGDCDTLSFCKQGQKCAVMKNTFFGQEVYSNDCILDVECGLPVAVDRKRNSNSVVCKCCSTDFCNSDCNIIPTETTLTKPAITTTPVTAADGGTGTCEDKVPRCLDFGENICTGDIYLKFRTENCRKYCGIC